MHIFWCKDSIIGHLKQVDALLMQLQKEVRFSLSSIDCEKNRVTNVLQSVLEKDNDLSHQKQLYDVLLLNYL